MLCFLLFSTAGMGAIALALLARPWTQYCAERELINTLQQRRARLQQLYDQQAELLANAANPAVVERAAINHLNYVPAGVNLETVTELPAAWPNLQIALSGIDRQSSPPESGRRQKLLANLAEKSTHQTILLILGSALVVLSLSCFCRQR